MILVVAHAGHWLVQLAYVAPLLVLVGILVANQVRERRERKEHAAGDQAPGAAAEPSGQGEDPVGPGARSERV